MMKRYIKSLLIAVLVLVFAGTAQAQTTGSATMNKGGKSSTIVLAYNDLYATFLDSIICVEYASNISFTATSKSPWITIDRIQDNNIYIRTIENETDQDRPGSIELQEVGGTYKTTFNITQEKSNVMSTIKGDVKVKIESGTASSFNGSEPIEKSFDGNLSTIYHSPYSQGHLPVKLTYNFSNALAIDYMVYTPRSGGGNGCFDEIELYYTLEGSNELISAGTHFLSGSSNPTTITFPTTILNPKSVTIYVNSGVGGYASCAEMEFFQINSSSQNLFTIFEDTLCTKLKSDVTDETISNLTNPFVRKLAKVVKSGNYNTEFRVDEYEPYPIINEISSSLRISGYDQYENPTGIYFTKGKDIAVFLDNPGTQNISLKIKYWTDSTEEGEGALVSSSYMLKNGLNKITPKNDGHGYISYYTSNWEKAPKVKVHFAMADINGCFKLAKYKLADGTIDRATAAADWKRILAGVTSSMFDVYGEFHHAVYPTKEFRNVYKDDGVDFALAYDSVVWYEQEIAGLMKYNKRPKSHMFSRTSLNGSMAAGGEGAVIPNPNGGYVEVKTLDYWGIGHELGHVNQIRPALKWLSTSEVTNNIYSAYVQHKLGNGDWAKSLNRSRYYRLESESHSGDDIRNGIGGRFNAYLNYGIKDKGKWLMTEGPDYYGSTPSGNPASRNYDHFVKLGPLWNMVLYFKECGIRPNLWYQLGEMARTYDTSGKTDGELQLNFMRAVMDSAKIDMIDFFEKVGMLRVYDDYLADYTSGWMRISQDQIDELKNYIKGKKYSPLETSVLYYISANNYEIFRDKRSLEIVKKNDGTNNADVTRVNSAGSASASGNYLFCIDLNVKNAVAYETYDNENQLMRITMKGFRNKMNNATFVLFPSNAKTVYAVAWDGTKELIYTAP